MQQLMICGNLAANARLVTSGERSYISFKVGDRVESTNLKGERTSGTMWFGCLLPGDRQKIAPYLVKGTKVVVIGRPSYRVYSSERDRQVKCGVDLFVERIELCGTSNHEQEYQ